MKKLSKPVGFFSLSTFKCKFAFCGGKQVTELEYWQLLLYTPKEGEKKVIKKYLKNIMNVFLQ